LSNNSPEGANRREENVPHCDLRRRESAVVIEQFCQSNGQILVPISGLVETVMPKIGVETLEMNWTPSAERVAEPRIQEKFSVEIRHYGTQSNVKLADREVHVKGPRLRHKTEGEVQILVYEALREERR
jgi:hypothetical protein